MPRKPKPPLVHLQIEGLSTGINPHLKDDWTGEVLAQPNAKVPPNLRAQQAEHKRIIRENQLQMLNALGITHEGYKPVQAKPALKYNQCKLGDNVVTVPSNPHAIKRRF